MVYRKMLYFHWTPTGNIMLCHRYISRDQMIKNVTRLPVLSLVLIAKSYHCASKLNKRVLPEFFFRMDLKCHRYDVTDADVEVFSVLYHASTTSDTEMDLP